MEVSHGFSNLIYYAAFVFGLERNDAKKDKKRKPSPTFLRVRETFSNPRFVFAIRSFHFHIGVFGSKGTRPGK